MMYQEPLSIADILDGNLFSHSTSIVSPSLSFTLDILRHSSQCFLEKEYQSTLELTEAFQEAGMAEMYQQILPLPTI